MESEKSRVMGNGRHSLAEISRTAAKVLKRGGIIAFPTETSYALGADAANEKAVRKIAEVKQQPVSKEVSVIVSSLEQMEKYCRISRETRKLAEKFLPGPLTLVVPMKKNPLQWLGKKTIAFRVSPNKIAFEICKKFGKPVTATSANIHGNPSIYTEKEIMREFFGKVDLIIVSGNLRKRKPSTLYDVKNRKLLREGKIKEKEILKAIKK